MTDTQLKPCPFCGAAGVKSRHGYYTCSNDHCNLVTMSDGWNYRPIEDALQAQIDGFTEKGGEGMKDINIIMGWNVGEGRTQAEELAQMEEQAEAEEEYNRTREAEEYNKAWEDHLLVDCQEKRIAVLESALDKAAHKLYDYSGSCPSDLYDWEHPNTCIRECDKYDNPDEAWKCWRLWLLEKPRDEQ